MATIKNLTISDSEFTTWKEGSDLSYMYGQLDKYQLLQTLGPEFTKVVYFKSVVYLTLYALH